MELGFSVPKTIVTNDPAAFLCFYENCSGEVIYKTLGKNQTRDAKGKFQFAYTNKLDKGFLECSAEIALTPCLFQEYIPKRVELRVTVVGNQVFACEIHSQKSERTRIDWRRYDLENTPHFPVKLPEDLIDKCLQLIRSFGLNFAAIDFIITPNNEYVFIEINPNG
jgi:glutathione synthase/RimK-type ligase-like ATP-grasp enzyme